MTQLGEGGVLANTSAHALTPNNEYLVLSVRMVMCVHDPDDGRGSNQIPPSVKCQVRLKHCMHHRPCPIYISMLITWGYSTSAHEGRMACVRARPCRGVGGSKHQPPPMPSTVMPHYDTPVSHVCTSIKSWLNKQAVLADHACSLPLRQKLCMYSLWFSSYI
jgi:hypothetical protein